MGVWAEGRCRPRAERTREQTDGGGGQWEVPSRTRPVWNAHKAVTWAMELLGDHKTGDINVEGPRSLDHVSSRGDGGDRPRSVQL